MLRFLIRRLAQSIPVIVGVTVIGFFLIHLIPGDPARVALGPRASRATVAALRHQLHLDEPLVQQYGHFVARAFQFDFGTSLIWREGVGPLLVSRLVPTVLLVGYATLIAVLVAVPASIASAVRHTRATDHAIRVGGMALFAMPSFWLGLILSLVFGLRLRLFPTSGYVAGVPGIFETLTLPSVAIACGLAPLLIRTLRASIIENLAAEYVEAARARGLAEVRILFRHVLRNSAISGVSVLGLLIGALLSGTVVIENVFNIPGLGSLLVTAVSNRDYPVVQGLVVVFGVGVILVNLLTDLVYALVDPRVRL